MTTDQDVAEWMYDQFKNTSFLFQEAVVMEIHREFGRDFVYINQNGNWAISKKVLAIFKKLTDGQAVWDRGARAWRKPYPNETYTGRQVD